MLNQKHVLVITALKCSLMIAFISFSFPAESSAQDSNLEKLLRIRPRQVGFQYDRPTQAEIKGCKVEKPAASTKSRGYVVRNRDGRILRQFLDTNADNQLDRWSYYKDGIEVYRDLDTNFDSKADQHRWMGTAGIRWGIDKNQDGKIDSWRMISAEEVASEVFESIKSGDTARFNRVLLTKSELDALKLGANLKDAVTKSLSKASSSFTNFARQQKLISQNSKWVHFGTSQPSLVPAGNASGQQDVVIYDHASAVFQNGRDFEQVAIGTIVQVGANSWRAVELPQMVVDGQAVANGGILFPAPNMVATNGDAPRMNPADVKFAELFNKLDEIEKQAARAQRQSDIEKLETKRAELRTQLIENSPKEDRVNWIESLADAVTDAYQRDRFSEGLNYLVGYKRKLKNAGQTAGLDYIDWRLLNTKVLQTNRRRRLPGTGQSNGKLCFRHARLLQKLSH